MTPQELLIASPKGHQTCLIIFVRVGCIDNPIVHCNDPFTRCSSWVTGIALDLPASAGTKRIDAIGITENHQAIINAQPLRYVNLIGEGMMPDHCSISGIQRVDVHATRDERNHINDLLPHGQYADLFPNLLLPEDSMVACPQSRYDPVCACQHQYLLLRTLRLSIAPFRLMRVGCEEDKKATQQENDNHHRSNGLGKRC